MGLKIRKTAIILSTNSLGRGKNSSTRDLSKRSKIQFWNLSGSAVHFMQQNTKQFIHLEIHGKLSRSRRHRLLVVSRHGETMTSVRATQYLLFLSKEQCTSWSQYARQLREGQKTNSNSAAIFKHSVGTDATELRKIFMRRPA